jgi:hypothetical protein
MEEQHQREEASSAQGNEDAVTGGLGGSTKSKRLKKGCLGCLGLFVGSIVLLTVLGALLGDGQPRPRKSNQSSANKKPTPENDFTALLRERGTPAPEWLTSHPDYVRWTTIWGEMHSPKANNEWLQKSMERLRRHAGFLESGPTDELLRKGLKLFEPKPRGLKHKESKEWTHPRAIRNLSSAMDILWRAVVASASADHLTAYLPFSEPQFSRIAQTHEFVKKSESQLATSSWGRKSVDSRWKRRLPDGKKEMHRIGLTTLDGKVISMEVSLGVRPWDVAVTAMAADKRDEYHAKILVDICGTPTRWIQPALALLGGEDEITPIMQQLKEISKSNVEDLRSMNLWGKKNEMGSIYLWKANCRTPSYSSNVIFASSDAYLLVQSLEAEQIAKARMELQANGRKIISDVVDLPPQP